MKLNQNHFLTPKFIVDNSAWLRDWLNVYNGVDKGIYFLVRKEGQITYVGISKDSILKRVRKSHLFFKQFEKIYAYHPPLELDLAYMEAVYIHWMRPFENSYYPNLDSFQKTLSNQLADKYCGESDFICNPERFCQEYLPNVMDMARRLG